MFRVVVFSLGTFLVVSFGAACRDAPVGASDASVSEPDAWVSEPDAFVPSPHVDPTPAGIAYFSFLDDSIVDAELVNALHNKLAADHVSISYNALYDVYETLDQGREGCTGVYDFYSSKCWDPSDACGNYSAEGDCFNREHSWPKSWWGGQVGPDQHEDLIAVIPADGYVNNSRGNLPFGSVSNASYTSTNGSKRGRCDVAGAPPGNCFEPPDRLKGDFARIYFYMAIRYEDEMSCCVEAAVNGADIYPWQEEMLRTWHRMDPVDIDERDRNEIIFGVQENRNPFVDYPALVDRIADF